MHMEVAMLSHLERPFICIYRIIPPYFIFMFKLLFRYGLAQGAPFDKIVR